MATVGVNFHGPITHPATIKLRTMLCSGVVNRFESGPNAGKRKYDKLILFMNSTGGNLDDGLSLFGLIRSLPLEVTTINMGVIASIAILPFLAGKNRFAVPHSHFHFHDYESNYPAAHNLTRIEHIDHIQLLDAIRHSTFEILKENTSLTNMDFHELKFLNEPMVKDAAFAKERGIVHEVKYFPVPEEMDIFNVEY